ncbi:pyridoxal-dependent decarboxylase [Bordetella sp. FB-8]|uniref:pyridoxal phosphate-dependent decarboxylase family protein n=1 Tax=Bordetella sp. FB-8 TaxID=1159870 RepID=UPI000368A658|nr:pyridoxal-dependent decarboxylase [Bordetella sp. FB-8]
MTGNAVGAAPNPDSLDPADWTALRRQGHQMLDDMFDYLATLRARPVWQPAPDSVRRRFSQDLPRRPSDLGEIHQRFMTEILPYGIGNVHPGFMGWVQGGGTAVGMLAETLAAGLNANVGGRSQIPIEVERQITRWMRDLFGFPASASGVFVTGTSTANLIGVLVASRARLGLQVRSRGLAAQAQRLVAYAAVSAHGCVAQAMDIAGLGTDALRLIPLDADLRMQPQALRAAIAADRQAGYTPFLIVGSAGTVDVGAVDPLPELADIAQHEGVWLHVDGAFGAMAMLSPELAPKVAGIERADSIAFDFHKWVQVPYDAGFVLVRDGQQHLDTFAADAAYLKRETRGMAGDSPWPCDFGPDLSRGFRALKTWFTLQVYGADALGRAIANSCRVARHLAARVQAEPVLELLAPVSLNIVCFRYLPAGIDGQQADSLNAAIVVALHEAGVCAPSTTTVNGRLAIRAAIVNHRTGTADVDHLVQGVLQIGNRMALEACL